jgi:hypothetical protein
MFCQVQKFQLVSIIKFEYFITTIKVCPLQFIVFVPILKVENEYCYWCYLVVCRKIEKIQEILLFLETVTEQSQRLDENRHIETIGQKKYFIKNIYYYKVKKKCIDMKKDKAAVRQFRPFLL